jgi:transposase InsO family protein
MGTHHDAALARGALLAAVTTRGQHRMDGTIFHSIRGAEYTSSACVDACQRLGLRRFMSSTGSCLDSAVAESWFASLKVELVDRHHHRTRAQARASIFRWIAWYNRFRLHSNRATCHPSSGNSSTPPPAHYRRPWPHNPRCPPPGGPGRPQRWRRSARLCGARCQPRRHG